MVARRAGASIVAAVIAFLAVACTSLLAEAEAAKPQQTMQLKAREIGRVLNPVYTAVPPGDAGRNKVFVVQRGGDVRIIRDGTLLRQRFLSVRDLVGDFNEQGLLSIAFHPRYERNGRVYAYFADLDDNVRVVSFERSADRPLSVDPDSMRDVITIPHPRFPAHNGGTVAFGPDGNMWLAPGDGGGPCDPDENAQNTESLLGKLLRITPLPNGGYTVPSDNPFVGQAGRDEIYAYGFRNPFRFSFDVRTNTITIGDVGQRRTEEIDRERLSVARGANFGWDALEGSDPLIHLDSCFENDPPTPLPAVSEPPILEYDHGDDYCSVTAGPIVRGPKLRALRGRLLYTDLCDGEIRSAIPGLAGASEDRSTRAEIAYPTSIVNAPDGSVYATSLFGEIYELKPVNKPRRRSGT